MVAVTSDENELSTSSVAVENTAQAISRAHVERFISEFCVGKDAEEFQDLAKQYCSDTLEADKMEDALKSYDLYCDLVGSFAKIIKVVKVFGRDTLFDGESAFSKYRYTVDEARLANREIYPNEKRSSGFYIKLAEIVRIEHALGEDFIKANPRIEYILLNLQNVNKDMIDYVFMGVSEFMAILTAVKEICLKSGMSETILSETVRRNIDSLNMKYDVNSLSPLTEGQYDSISYLFTPLCSLSRILKFLEKVKGTDYYEIPDKTWTNTVNLINLFVYRLSQKPVRRLIDTLLINEEQGQEFFLNTNVLSSILGKLQNRLIVKKYAGTDLDNRLTKDELLLMRRVIKDLRLSLQLIEQRKIIERRLYHSNYKAPLYKITVADFDF